MDDNNLLKKLEDLKDKQWASKVLAEVRTQMNDFEYQIVFKTKEDEFFGALRDFSSAGYEVLPGTTLFQNGTFIVLMRRDKAKNTELRAPSAVTERRSDVGGAPAPELLPSEEV